jgi:hypothetical protein
VSGLTHRWYEAKDRGDGPSAQLRLGQIQLDTRNHLPLDNCNG